MTAVDIAPSWTVNGLVVTDYPFSVPFGGVDYGKPSVTRQIIESVLSRGDYDVVTKTGNRVVSLPVLVEDADMAALADAEKLLAEACDVPFGEVVCDPGDGFGEPFVFDVYQGELTYTRSDEYEQNGLRLYALTFPAKPFPRSVDPIALTPTGTNVLTAKQKLYEITVAGSAATEPDLHVGGSSALGTVLIYTRAGGGGFIPLRQHRTSGSSVTPDISQVSGGYEDVSTNPFVAEVDKTDVVDGRYVLLARIGASDTTKTVNATVSAQTVGFDLTTPTSLTVSALWPTSGAIVQIGGSFQLPAAVVADEGATTIRVSIQAAAGGATALIDEAWLAEVETGQLTRVESAPTTVGMIDAKHFWLEQPAPGRPGRQVIKGAFPAKAAAFGASPDRWGDHEFKPGLNGLAVVSTGTTSVALDLEYHPRWFTHAGTV